VPDLKNKITFLAFRAEFLKLCPCMKKKDDPLKKRRNNGLPESNFLELQTLNHPGISGADEPTTPRTELPD